MRKRLSSFSYSSAPPPSPIPTGKGSRSAVDSILGEYIHQSVNVPRLTLPHRWAPDEIHYKSLLQRENDAMNRLLSSAAEFGVVRIIGHGISGEELRTMLIKNEWLFRLSEKYANYDKFLWDWSDNAMVQKAKVAIGDGNFLLFRVLLTTRKQNWLRGALVLKLEDAAGKKGHNKKRNAANKSQEVEVPSKVVPNEGLTSQEPSTTEESEDDVEVLSEDVSLGKEWVMKVNVGMDSIDIFGQRLGKVEGTFSVLEGHILEEIESI
ncbi:uncharacterized protein LOC132630984 [Lycium barbarum]|uniref:uncharacterized protein LOC132630984 n=1 Tax=Lycium barbarum TaxID=112863 RepID=UPI00293F438D|nr:uncharacterized protein LOC132630984 [Lycium barbarum]